MLRQALKSRGNRGGVSRTVGLPAPWRGLNARDRQEEAKPGYASILDNFYPGDGEVTLRKGWASHATGLPSAAVETLMEYSTGSTQKLFAAVDDDIYDVTSAGAVSDPEVTGLTNSRWSHTMFATTGGQFLTAVNGADDLHRYDGSNWYPVYATNLYSIDYDAETGAFTVGETLTGGTSGATGTIVKVIDNGTTGTLWINNVSGLSFTDNETITDSSTGSADADGVETLLTTALTGIATTSLDQVVAHKSRLWFVEKNSLSAWYLGTLAISGAATEFPIAALCKRGGYLVACSGWSVDTGDGADDFFVFLTSEGECLVYAGTDPSSASTWALKGIYQTDRPIGRRCLLKFGADLLILTESGVVSVSALLGATSRWAQISELVRPDFLAQSLSYGSSFGWQMIHYRRRGWLIVNAPSAAGAYMQFGYNSQIKPPDGWFTMSNQNGSCWGELDGDLYFGGAGTVYKADTGVSDDGDEIIGDVLWAWSSFGTGAQKRFTLARPHMRCDVAPSPQLDMRVDYDDAQPTSSPTITSLATGADWDTADWDVAEWGGSLSVYSQWAGVTGLGYVGGPRLKIKTSTAEFAVIRAEVVFETGGIL